MLRTIRGMAMVAAVAALTNAWAAHGPRLVAHVSEPFEVAGQLYPAGRLTLQTVSSYTPTTSIDEVWIDDDCLGLLVAERTRAAKDFSGDTVLFERNALGRLVLVGYVLRGDGTNDTAHRYRDARKEDALLAAR